MKHSVKQKGLGWVVSQTVAKKDVERYIKKHPDMVKNLAERIAAVVNGKGTGPEKRWHPEVLIASKLAGFAGEKIADEIDRKEMVNFVLCAAGWDMAIEFLRRYPEYVSRWGLK